MELRVSSYGSRADLEAHCEHLDPAVKPGAIIVGSVEELARFQLGPTSRVHGVSVMSNSAPMVVTDAKKPKRIKGKGYGLNGNLTTLDKE